MSMLLKKDLSFQSEILSLHPDLLRDIFLYAKPFGHHEDSKNLNLGFGFLYYGVVRALRPARIDFPGAA